MSMSTLLGYCLFNGLDMSISLYSKAFSIYRKVLLKNMLDMMEGHI